MPAHIQAFLPQQIFAVGEKIPLTLAVSNPEPEVISVIDPRRGGKYFRLRIMVAPDEWRVVTMAEALSAPGVPVIVTQVQVPVGGKWDFDFDLSKLTSLDQPGSFALVVEYEWLPGQVWTSSPIPFWIVSSASGSLVITPSEATRAGYHSLVWVQGNGDEGRALMLDFRIQQLTPPIKGAIEIARVKPSSPLTLSMSPAGSPFPDRWVGWISDERVYFSYWARAEQDRLAAASFSTGGFQPQLIRPILASSAPDEGRPGCLIGLLFRSAGGQQMVGVEVNADGQYRLLNHQPLGGMVKEAWATAPGDGVRLFVFASQSRQTVEILSVSCLLGEGSRAPMSWFSTEGEFLAGDVRVMPDHTVRVGILLNRGEEWERLTFDAPPSGQMPVPSAARFKPGPQAVAARARIDGNGDLHSLFLRDGALHYAPPKATAEVSSHERPVVAGNSPDLLISLDGRVALVYYDLEKGPTLLRI